MRLFTALTAFTLAATLSFPALAGTMQITGHGEVVAAPDTAYVSSGVTSQGATAKEALDANSEAMTALIAALKAAGIDPKDIQTSGFSVNPNYVYTDARDANGYTLPPKINGYIVTNGVTVRVRDLTILGGVLDQAVTVGANTINGVSFAVADPSDLYDEARKQAIADAKHKADLYASAASLEIGAIELISEQIGYVPPQPYEMRAEALAAPMDKAVPVEAGQLTFSIDVNVNWTIDPTR